MTNATRTIDVLKYSPDGSAALAKSSESDCPCGIK